MPHQSKQMKHGRKRDPTPMSHDLLISSIVNLQSLGPSYCPYPPSYEENSRCEHKVQDLINNKQLTFEKGVPLVKSHPLSLQVQELQRSVS